MAQTPDTQANMRWLPHVNVITPLLRLHRLSLAAAAVAAPTPGAGCQLLSPSTPPHRAALLSRFGQQGLSLSLHMHSPHMGQFLQDGENACFVSFFFKK